MLAYEADLRWLLRHASPSIFPREDCLRFDYSCEWKLEVSDLASTSQLCLNFAKFSGRSFVWP